MIITSRIPSSNRCLRYDEIIKNIPNKAKCVDGTFLYGQNIESAFYRTCNFLKLSSEKGIIFNKKKFRFCVDVVNLQDKKSLHLVLLPQIVS